MNAEFSETAGWAQWVNRSVNGVFPLRRLLGCSAHNAVFLTEYKAKNLADAAIKLVRADASQAKALLAQWAAAAQLSHPHLVRLFEMGRYRAGEHEFVFVVMEYADQTLADILLRRALSHEEVRELLFPTLDALTFLHRRHLVHGGLEPSNVLAVDDQLKLATDTLRPAGQGFATTDDVWKLGATLVEALTQHAPSAAEPRFEVGLPADLPAGLADTVRRCMSPTAADRPTVIDLRSEYKPGASKEPVSAPAPPARVASHVQAPVVSRPPTPAATSKPQTQAPAVSKAQPEAPAISQPQVQPAAVSKTQPQAPAVSQPQARPAAASKPQTHTPAVAQPQPKSPAVSHDQAQPAVTSKTQSQTPAVSHAQPQAPAVSHPPAQPAAISKPHTQAPVALLRQPKAPADPHSQAQQAAASKPSQTHAPAISQPPPKAPAVSHDQAQQARVVSKAQPQPAVSQARGGLESTPPPPSKRHLPLLIIAATAAILMAAWLGLRSTSTPQADLQPPAVPAPAPAAPSPIAKLPPAESNRTRDVSSPPSQPPLSAASAVLHEVTPDVPEKIRQTIQGRIHVTVRVLVDPSGDVTGALMENPGPSKYFARLADNAAREWQFAPADDERARVWLVTFVFTRDGVSTRATEQ